MSLTKVTYSMITPEHYNKGRLFHHPFVNDTTIVQNGPADEYHRHFGSVAEGINGRLHMVYRRGPEHAVSSGASTFYCYSDNGGVTWSAEVQIVAPESGFDMRGAFLCVTPTGRLILTYSKAVAPAAAPTVFKLKYSDDDGETWQEGNDIATINFSFARIYGRPKVISGLNDKGYRLVITPYYQVSATPTYKIAAWYSDDDGVTWVEGTPIQNQINGHNETELIQGSGDIWFAVARGNGLNLYQTLNAGASWSLVGEVLTANGVAPSVDRFEYQGRVYIVLGYCDRNTDQTVFKIAEMQNILDIGEDAFGPPLIVSSDMVNASGYQMTVTDPWGNLYVDGGTAFVEFKEYTGAEPENPYSQVRFKRVDLFDLLQQSGRAYIPDAGAITVASTFLEPRMLLGTGGLSLIELDTINGGYNGQTIEFGSTSSSLDTVLHGGVGNLILQSDFRFNTSGLDGSRILLRKCGNNWIEIGRSNDNVFIPKEIISGEITMDNAMVPVFQFVAAEGSTGADDLDTINGGYDGQIVTFSTPTSAYTVTFKDNTGNLRLESDFTLDNGTDTITLIQYAGVWREICRSNNG